MSEAPFGFGGLRRSVVDPETGRPVITSAPTGALKYRADLLPIGVNDSGRLTPAVPGLIMGAIEAAKYPAQVWRGEKDVLDDSGHVSDEAIGKANEIAGLAMTGSLPFSAPKGVLRSFGGAAKDGGDPLAALEASLNALDLPVSAGTRHMLDPSAKSWNLYHGSPAGPDFKRFDPHHGRAHSESGALFLAPNPEMAEFYTGTGTAAAGDAGARMFRVSVDPGKTDVIDLPSLVANDPSFQARASRVTLKEYEDRGIPVNARRVDAERDAYRDQVIANRDRDGAVNAQLAGMGLPQTAATGVTSGQGYVGAAIDLARERGLDTAIIRGLEEHGLGDQVVALTPNRVRSYYAPDQLLYGLAGLTAGGALAATAAPDDAQAMPAPQRAPFGFGPFQ